MQSPIVRSAGNVSKWMQRNMVNEESEYYTKKKRPEIFFCNAWLVKGVFFVVLFLRYVAHLVLFCICHNIHTVKFAAQLYSLPPSSKLCVYRCPVRENEAGE